jgi:hypothetical protein
MPMTAGIGIACTGVVSVGVSTDWGTLVGTVVGTVAGGTGVSGTAVAGTVNRGTWMVVGRGSGIIGVGTGVGIPPRTTGTSSPGSAGFPATMWNCWMAVAEEVLNRTTPCPLTSVVTSA